MLFCTKNTRIKSDIAVDAGEMSAEEQEKVTKFEKSMKI